MKKYNKEYKYRLLARVVLETTTPLSIGSGESNIVTDHLIARDVNELPYISGTAIAGIIRHYIGEEEAAKFFGNSSQKGGDNVGNGSQIIFSSGYLVNEDGRVVEGLISGSNDYLSRFAYLPVRQHVRIDAKGVAVDKGKFDNEIVYKGTRFCFEIEMITEKDEADYLKTILMSLLDDTLRIGSGTRSGYGGFKVVENKVSTLNLSNTEEMQKYIAKTSSLNDTFWQSNFVNLLTPKQIEYNKDWVRYKLNLQPDDFFIFGSGLGNEHADATSTTESYIVWEEGCPVFKDNAIVVPASSIKGAIAHRVAFHYNNQIGKIRLDTENDLLELEKIVGENNEAIQSLFGFVEDEKAQQGNLIISDIIIEANPKNKVKHVQKHVVIDSFTGGAEKGKLFQEELLHKDNLGGNLELVFYVKATVGEKQKQAFEATIADLEHGFLALGGLTNWGNGTFKSVNNE